MDYRKYEVWHDESKEGGYHHGLLFIPVDKKEEIIKLLKKIRKEYNIEYNHDFKFAGSLKKKFNSQVINNFLSVFAHIIKCRINYKKNIYPIKILKNNGPYRGGVETILELEELFECKFALLRIKDNMNSMYFDTYAKKVETTFRFVLKSCCHSMFNNENPIEIIKFYFDGDEHHGKKIDISNLIKGEVKEHIKINKNIDIDSRQINQRDDDTKILMNFVDNIIGSCRSILNDESDENNALFPLREIHERLKDNLLILNENSEWYKSISFSDLVIENENISFPDIFRNPQQGTLL